MDGQVIFGLSSLILCQMIICIIGQGYKFTFKFNDQTRHSFRKK